MKRIKLKKDEKESESKDKLDSLNPKTYKGSHKKEHHNQYGKKDDKKD